MIDKFNSDISLSGQKPQSKTNREFDRETREIYEKKSIFIFVYFAGFAIYGLFIELLQCSTSYLTTKNKTVKAAAAAAPAISPIFAPLDQPLETFAASL